MEIKRYEFFGGRNPVKKAVKLVQVASDCWAIDVKSNVSGELNGFCLKIYLDRPTAEREFDLLVEWLKR